MKLTSATFLMNGKTVNATKLISGFVTVTVFPENRTFNFSCKILNNDGNEVSFPELQQLRRLRLR